MTKLAFTYRLTESTMHEAYISDGEREARIDVWYLWDGLAELARTAVQLLEGCEWAYCVWEDDPGEHKWLLQRRGDSLHVTILRFPNSFNGYGAPDEWADVIFETTCPLLKFAGKVRNELRRRLSELGAEEYRRRARAPFPRDRYDALRRLNRERQAVA